MKRLLASCFGLGRLPLAPGTWGSLPVVFIFGFVCYMGVSAASASIMMAVLALAGSVVCVMFAPSVMETTGKIDPRQVVADEFAGQAVTFLPAAFLITPDAAAGRILAVTLAGFLLFRLFDIVKPWPIRLLEKLPAGWGILADDIMAGVYAGVLLQVCLRLWWTLPTI